MTIMLGEGKEDKALELVQELVKEVEAAAHEGMAADRMEQSLWQGVMKMGRCLLGYFFRLQGDGNAGEEVAGEGGQKLKRSKELHARRYVSLFGEYELRRWVYAEWEGRRAEQIPFDARLGLPASDYSYPLQEWGQALAVQLSYRPVGAMLERMLGLKLGVSALERMNAAMAQSVPAYWEARPGVPQAKGEFVVVSADGKGVPIRKVEAAPKIEQHDRQRGPQPDKKRVAIVGAVFEACARPRTPEEVWCSLFHLPAVAANDEPLSPDPQRPLARALRACLPGPETSARPPLFAWLGQQVRSRDPAAQKPVVVVMDGQHCLWDDAAQALAGHAAPRVEILDLLHATSHLWDLVHLLYPRGSANALVEMKIYTLALLQGKIDQVLIWYRRRLDEQARSADMRRQAESLCGYFERHRSRMHYAAYLAAGYPIASGVIEGACRHVVRDRLEQSGMRWCLEGAQAMLDLRCVMLNDQWDDFVQYRRRSEQNRLYPYAAPDEAVSWPVAA